MSFEEVDTVEAYFFVPRGIPPRPARIAVLLEGASVMYESMTGLVIHPDPADEYRFMRIQHRSDFENNALPAALAGTTRHLDFMPRDWSREDRLTVERWARGTYERIRGMEQHIGRVEERVRLDIRGGFAFSMPTRDEIDEPEWVFRTFLEVPRVDPTGLEPAWLSDELNETARLAACEVWDIYTFLLEGDARATQSQ